MVDAEPVEFRRLITAPDTEHQPAPAEGVDHGGVFGHPQGMLERKDDDGCADSDGLRAPGDCGREQQRIPKHAVNREMVLG